jgi:DNA-binding transcriptional regulator YdaS (Cro superfamily)
MKSAALVMLVLLTASDPSMAKRYHGHRTVAHTTHHANRISERASHSGVTCDMVRAYVAQVGLAQAVAAAQSAGITAADKERAKRCLAEKSEGKSS